MVEEAEEAPADPQCAHEERRLVERFASYHSGRQAASPKNGARWRNKRKETDSPRQFPVRDATASRRQVSDDELPDAAIIADSNGGTLLC